MNEGPKIIAPNEAPQLIYTQIQKEIDHLKRHNLKVGMALFKLDGCHIEVMIYNVQEYKRDLDKRVEKFYEFGNKA